MMTAAFGSGGRAASALMRGSRRTCTRCAAHGTQPSPHLLRPYSEASVAATVPLSTVPPPLSDAVIPPVAQPKTSSPYHIRSGLILTRPPLLTREQTPFESAFYLYQKRLNERLSAPFRRAFYFRQDTAADLDWRLKHQEREGVAGRDIGRYKSRGRLSWNDELLIGSATSDPAQVVEKLVQDAEMRVSEDGEVIAPEDRVKLERPRPRRTEADENGDVRRLDRALDQTLYLVVRRGKGESATWGFPTGAVKTDEALHETAERVLAESAGVNMNTWIVGRHPVAHYSTKPVYREDGKTLAQKGNKVFFLKGRIMAGQADLSSNRRGLTDFKWLTKHELEEQLPSSYYWRLRGMMAER